MRPLKVSDATHRILRDIVRAWPQISERLKTWQQGTPEKRAPATLSGDGSCWVKIISSESVGTNKWNYKVRLMQSGANTHTGLDVTDLTIEFDARNTWETLTKAGYVNTNVTALKAIPNDAIVRAYPEVRNGARVFVFSERNEPECEEA